MTGLNEPIILPSFVPAVWRGKHPLHPAHIASRFAYITSCGVREHHGEVVVCAGRHLRALAASGEASEKAASESETEYETDATSPKMHSRRKSNGQTKASLKRRILKPGLEVKQDVHNKTHPRPYTC